MKHIFVATIFILLLLNVKGQPNPDSAIVTSVQIYRPNMPQEWLKHKLDSESVRKGDLLYIPMIFGMKVGDPIILGGRVYVLRGYYPVYAPTDLMASLPKKLFSMPVIIKEYLTLPKIWW